MTSPTPPRKAGAPKGNTNALKHGFYARALKERQTAGLEDLSPTSLADEIDLMRLIIRRTVELSEETTDPYLTAALLRSVAFAASSLTRLVRLQQYLGTSGRDLLNQAMDTAIQDFWASIDEFKEKHKDDDPAQVPNFFKHPLPPRID